MSGGGPFPAGELERFAAGVLAALRLPAADAATVARALVAADLEGIGTHGLGRLPNYVARLRKGLVNPTPHLHFVERMGSTALLDADNAMGQVAATAAMAEAIRLAGGGGIGWVGVRGSNHFGAASFYTALAAEAGMIGIALSNSPSGMAPWGGREAFLGTNPISIGVPAGTSPPVAIDLATSATARGAVIKAAAEGTPLAPGLALDAAGEPTEDAAAALQGALLPLGGPKGYALALAVEVLCGPLVGGAISPEIPSYFDDWETPSNVGHTLAALNPAAFGAPERFRARVDQLVEGIKGVPPAAGSDGPRLPGERRAREVARRRAAGVPLAPAAVEQLRRIGDELGVGFPGGGAAVRLMERKEQ